MIFYTHLEFPFNFSGIVYDEEKGVLKASKEINPYYINNKVTEYAIGYSANYALYLLNEKSDEYTKHACKILQNIFDAQIKDMQSEYYGTWLYGFFESTDDYVAPDYIYQPEITSVLMEIYLEFRDYLPYDIVEELKNCCCLAAFATIHHCHEIDSSFVLLEILTTICIGEQFNKKEYVNFSIAKMQTLVYYTLYNDAYMEYNYPGKIIIFLEAISFFREHIKNQYCLQSIHNIEKTLLTCFYSHFNPKIMQWTGPKSSTSGDFVPQYFIKHIPNIVNIKNLKSMKIPPEYYEFSPASGENFTQLLVTRGFSYPHWKFPTVASFYNNPDFSFGSFNRDDLWESRRPCIAYFGTAQSPYCLRIRCLLNNHDFSSATLHSVQHKGNLLGHITFSTNRGNVHMVVDSAQSFKMTDLRIRFQILGDTSMLECFNKHNSLSVLYKTLSISYALDYVSFNNNKISYQLTSASDALYFDAVLYSGEETDLNISQIEEAITSFSLSLSTQDIKPAAVKTNSDGEFLISEQKTTDVTLKLKTPKKPNIIEFMTLFDRQYINGVRLEKHVDIGKKLSGQYRFIAESNISPVTAISANHFTENKTYLTKIKNLNKTPIDKIDANIQELLNGLNNLSLDIARRYSIHIIANIFDSAKRSDVRFKNIIGTHYSQIYDELSYTTKISKMKKIILDIISSLQHDYQKLLTNTKKSDKIAKVIEIVRSNYSNPNLSLQTISSELGISQAHLSREFHATMGSSYVSYLLQVRMEHAKKLLTAGNSIKDVIKKCGYISDVTFNAAFKRYTGTTAKKYLHSVQNEQN